MSEVIRSAVATWRGTISEGEGAVAPASRAFGRVPISWQARTADWDGQTNPEELLATAFGASFVLALAAVLSERNAAPADLQVGISCSNHGEDTITQIVARVSGSVPGYADRDMQAVAVTALERCAVAKALRGNVAVLIEGG